MNLLTLIILLSILIAIYIPISVYIRSLKKNGVVILKARKTHSNRTLKFVRGNTYTFYKNEDRLMLNTDEEGFRDNFTFYREDLVDGFYPTDFYSKLIFNRVSNYNQE